MSNAELKELLLEALESEYGACRDGAVATAVAEPAGATPPRVLRELLESLLALTIELEDELEDEMDRELDEPARIARTG